MNLLIVLIVFITIIVLGLHWVTMAFSEPFFDIGVVLAVDSDGNCYVAGCHTGGADLDPGPGTDWHEPEYDSEIFIIKFDAEGNQVWADTREGHHWKNRGFDLLADSDGSVYVSGYHSLYSLGPNSSTYSYLNKFDMDGNVVWSYDWPHVMSRDLAFNESGNIIMAGAALDEVDLDPNPGQGSVVRGKDTVFISEFDSDGDYLESIVWQSEDSYDIVIDGINSVYIYGRDYGSYRHSYEHSLRKFDMNGQVWEFTWVAVRILEPYYGPLHGDGYVAIRENGNVILTGASSGTLGEGIDTRISQADHDAGTNAFMVEFDPDGHVLWNQTWQSHSSAWPSGVTVDKDGSIYITGNFFRTVDFDPGEDVGEFSSNGKQDIFLSRFTSDGQYEWTRTWGGRGDDRANDVVTGDNGEIFVTGMFSGTVDLDPGPAVNRFRSINANDAFLVKLDTDGTFIWARTWGGENARYYY